jgi:hypothetical protein
MLNQLKLLAAEFSIIPFTQIFAVVPSYEACSMYWVFVAATVVLAIAAELESPLHCTPKKKLPLEPFIKYRLPAHVAPSPMSRIP